MEEILRRFAADLLSALHAAHPAEYFFEIEVLAVNSEWVGAFAKSDGVLDDRITVNLQMPADAFLKQVNDLKPANLNFRYELWKDLERDQRPILGYTRRQIYMIRGGFSPEMWTRDQAFQQLVFILSAMTTSLAPALLDEWLSLSQKECSWSAFEDLVRRTINCLFTPELGEARFQSRTEVDPGQERRDVIAHNKADTGFWKDLKDKFKSSEILFEVKRKISLERDDLRQTYCYLKESLGYWGFLVFCGPKDESALAPSRRRVGGPGLQRWFMEAPRLTKCRCSAFFFGTLSLYPVCSVSASPGLRGICYPGAPSAKHPQPRKPSRLRPIHSRPRP